MPRTGTFSIHLKCANAHTKSFSQHRKLSGAAGSRAAMVSFEDFVNRSKECLRNCQAESRCRLRVDGKLELGRPLDRNIARFCAAKNLVHHFGGLSEQTGVVRSI